MTLDIATLRAALATAEYSGEWMVGRPREGSPYVETTQLAKAGHEKGVRYGMNAWLCEDCTEEYERTFALNEAQLIVAAVNALPEALDRIEELERQLGVGK